MEKFFDQMPIKFVYHSKFYGKHLSNKEMKEGGNVYAHGSIRRCWGSEMRCVIQISEDEVENKMMKGRKERN